MLNIHNNKGYGGITITKKIINTSETKINNIAYKVNVYQSKDARETAEQKISRLIKNAVVDEFNSPKITHFT